MRQRGQGLVEFSLVLTVLAVVFIGLIEVGSLMMEYQTLDTISREISRYAARDVRLSYVEDFAKSQLGDKHSSWTVRLVYYDLTDIDSTRIVSSTFGTAAHAFGTVPDPTLYEENEMVVTEMREAAGYSRKPLRLALAEILYEHKPVTGFFGTASKLIYSKSSFRVLDERSVGEK